MFKIDSLKGDIFSHFQTFPSFWPEQQRSKKYGQVFTVEHQSHAHTPNIRSWVFKINKKVRLGFPGSLSVCTLIQYSCVLFILRQH